MKYRSETEWTFDHAQAEQNALPAGRLRGPSEPLFQWFAMRALDEYERSFARSPSGFDVLAGIRVCANHDIVMPSWLAHAFISRYDQVLTCKTNSWDEAFDEPYPGKQIQRLRQDRQKGALVWNAVWRILQDEPDTAIDRELFEHVGTMKGIDFGATKVQELYLREKEYWAPRSISQKKEI